MKERPILFSSSMVRAILAGTKTQTRRVVKPQQPRETQPLDAPYEFELTERNGDVTLYTMEQFVGKCPYGAPGARLWCRETWGLHDHGDQSAFTCQSVLGLSEDFVRERYAITYRADWGSNKEECYWRPSIHMPRWVSRITLEVTGVRVERLQAITEADAKAEGVASGRIPADDYGPERIGYVLGHDDGKCVLYPNERRAFEVGWKDINGSESWDANPWVWVVEFSRVEAQAKEAAA